jgi:tRNA nucleotidyltransferase (CCA-adding enzyme)
MPQIENMVDKLSRRLPEDGRFLSSAVRSEAEAAGLRAFLVGGTVRDLLLDRASLDVDVAVEGDAVSLARALADRENAITLAKTTVFGTATLKAGGSSLDLVTARAETYARPGALPRVRPSTIDDDLQRRDFSINAMAVQLTEPAAGKLIDPTGGITDLRIGLIRVLHDGSFADDATRILRAARYESRFGFRLEERTLDLLRSHVNFVETISGTRLRREFARTLEEAEPERALLRLDKLGVLGAVHSSLAFTDEQADAMVRLRELCAPPLAAWPVFAWNAASAPNFARRLALTRLQAEAVGAIPEALGAARSISDTAPPSRVAHLLDAFPVATVFALAAMSNNPRIADYLTSSRGTRPVLTGEDVIAAGVPRGPDVALALERLRAARLDGEARTRADEERLIEQFLARERLGLA